MIVWNNSPALQQCMLILRKVFVYLDTCCGPLQVILNADISKRVKSAFFNQYVLKQTALLLIREPAESDDRDELSSFRQLVLDFLLTLCTDFRLGICYKSKPPPHGLER